MRKRCEGYRNQSPALPSRASCSRCFMALNPIVPIRKRKNKNLALSATFLRLGAAAISLNTDIGSKVQQINCWEAFFRLLRVGEDCQSKKNCRKGEIFVFKTSGSLQQAGCTGWQCCNKGLPQRGDFCSRQCCNGGVPQRVGVVVGGLAQWVVSCGDHAKPSCGSGAERRAVLLCG